MSLEKPTGFRFSDRTQQNFKEYAGSNHYTQDEALSSLLDSAKRVSPLSALDLPPEAGPHIQKFLDNLRTAEVQCAECLSAVSSAQQATADQQSIQIKGKNDYIRRLIDDNTAQAVTIAELRQTLERQQKEIQQLHGTVESLTQQNTTLQQTISSFNLTSQRLVEELESLRAASRHREKENKE